MSWLLNKGWWHLTLAENPIASLHIFMLILLTRFLILKYVEDIILILLLGLQLLVVGSKVGLLIL